MNKRSSTTASSGGVGCLTVIGIVLVVLKLFNLIDWSWIWVLAPFWGGCIFTVIVLLIFGIVAFLLNR